MAWAPWPAPPCAGGGPRVAALGGGTGLPIVLRGLKSFLPAADGSPGGRRDAGRLTAIVTVADDGGSSGRLRRAYGLPPPGDLRNCLVALADGDRAIASLFSFRFNGRGERGLTGHSLGNLLIAALSDIEGDFLGALDRAATLLRARGRVLPVSLQPLTLYATFADGRTRAGESRITAARGTIRRVALRPAAAVALPQAVAALRRADLIVLGPGSLYTSLIPVLLVPGIAAAVARSGARVVLVLNAMSEPGETDGHTAADFVRALRRHSPGLRIDDVLINTAPIPAAVLRRYAAAGARPIPAAPRALAGLGCRVAWRDLLGAGAVVRHDPDRLAAALLDLAATARPPGSGRRAARLREQEGAPCR
ncbi:MAG: gluconeogenesis factor YvcK family protein [Candidatus Polarisedimenticolia bacterium]